MLTQTQQTAGESLILKAEQLTGYTPQDILSPCRQRELVITRMCIAKALRDSGWKLREIAELLKRGDHSTVIHSLKEYDLCVFRGEKEIIELADSLTRCYVLDNRGRDYFSRKNITNRMRANGSSMLAVLGVVG